MNPPLILTRQTLHPHTLQLRAGMGMLQVENLGPLSGPSLGVFMGGDVEPFPNFRDFALRVGAGFDQTRYTGSSSSIARSTFAAEFGPNLSLADRWLSLGVYGRAGVDVDFSPQLNLRSGNTRALENESSAHLGIRSELCLAGEALCLSHEYNTNHVASPSDYRTKSHLFLAALDFLRLSAFMNQHRNGLDNSLAHFFTDTEISLHTLAGITWAPLAPVGGGAPYPYRTIEGNSLIPRWNNTQLLIRHKATAQSPFGFTIGLNLGQDIFLNPSYGLNASLVEGALNFVVLPAYVTYAFSPSLRAEAGILPTTIGFEDPQHQNRMPLTASLVFPWQPYWITGARMVYDVNPNHSLYLGFSQRTDAAFDHMPGTTALLGYTYTSETNVLSLNALLGEEDLGPRAILDLIWTHNFTSQSSMVVNADIGTRAVDDTGNKVYAFANALFTHHWDNQRWRAFIRPEVLYDSGTTGLDQMLISATAGIRRDFPHFIHNGNLGIELTGRADCSVWRAAGTNSPYADGNLCNPTLGLNAIWSLPIHPPAH